MQYVEYWVYRMSGFWSYQGDNVLIKNIKDNKKY